MSLLSREKSKHSSQPEELYEFTINQTYWRHTSADHTVTHDLREFKPIPIRRGKVEQNNDINKASLTVKTTRDNPFVVAFLAGDLGRQASLTVYRRQVGETDYMVLWKGRVISIVFDGAEAKISCESLFTSLKRQGLRAKYQALCRHALYSAKCRASSALFQVSSIVTGINGSVITVSAAETYGDGWFVGGFVKYGDYIYRSINGHVGANIDLDRAIQGLTTGDTLRLYPGCDHTSTCCRDKFDNLVNFGGFEFIPNVSPFSSLGNSLL
jgi:uncharacterized phage protein (TIGR02218 family)